MRSLLRPPAKTEFDKASDALIALEDTLDRMDRRLHGQYEFAWQATLAKKSHALPLKAATRADVQPLHKKLANRDREIQSSATCHSCASCRCQGAGSRACKPHPPSRRGPRRMPKRSISYPPSSISCLPPSTRPETDADYKSAVAAASKFMHAHSSKPKRAKFDPEHLAFGPSKTRARHALTDPAALRKKLGLTASVAPESNAKSTASSGESSGTKAGNRRWPPLVATDSSLPANLAPTEDVQITPAITAKAEALDNNPLKIYQYVRNNVEYMPTYGSIEGSDYTMQTLRGNDMDQASLLIALLRAANIPAHYVYGTIRVPIDQVENWVGNVTDPQAALDLMSQGGIPTLGLAQGGVIKFAQIEHVWVEAQMSYGPSRGAVTTPGDTWVPMDPSFKQYTYTDGMDLKNAVPFDAQAFADHIKNTSTINTSEGWVQGVDQNYITHPAHRLPEPRSRTTSPTKTPMPLSAMSSAPRPSSLKPCRCWPRACLTR